MITILLAALFLLLGSAVGAVINWFAGSVNGEGEFHLKAPACPKCGAQRSWKHLLPLLGFFMARGRCPQCSEPLSARIPVVEFLTGMLFASLYLGYGISWELLILLVYASLLIVLFITDYEHFLLPNVVTYPGILLAAAVALLVTLLQYPLPWALSFAGQGFMAIFNNFFLSAMAGGVSGALLLLLVVILSRGGMGMGDVKLAGLLGLMVGFPLVFIALFIGIWAGGLVAIALLISGKKKRREMLPFGPFLCIGGLAALLWGRQILAWYLGLI
jgi:leader peptidase (prepilin peptidase) / N-methyltransferase